MLHALVRSAVAAAALFCAVAPAVRAQELLDPLPVRDQFLLNNGFFFFDPASAHILGDGEWSAGMHATLSNTFAKSAWVSRSLEFHTPRASAAELLKDPRFAADGPYFFVQGELRRQTFSIRRGIGDRFEVSVDVPVISIGGGSTDAVIEAFHRDLGLGNAERETVARNVETIELHAGNVNFVRQRATHAELGDIALSGKYELRAIEDDRYAFAVEGALELPTGRAATLSGSGSVDGGMQFLATRSFARTSVHGSMGVLFLGADRVIGTRRQAIVTDSLAVAHLVTDRTSTVLQVTVSETPFRQFRIPEFLRRSYQLTAGVQHELTHAVVHFGFIENLFTYDNSADVGIEWGISRRF